MGSSTAEGTRECGATSVRSCKIYNVEYTPSSCVTHEVFNLVVVK